MFYHLAMVAVRIDLTCDHTGPAPGPGLSLVSASSKKTGVLCGLKWLCCGGF